VRIKITFIFFSIILACSLICSNSLLYAGKQEDIEKAVKALDTINKDDKNEAMQELVGYGKDAVAPLLAVAKDKSNIASWRSKCINALGEIKDTKVSGDIIAIIIDEENPGRVRKEAIRAIGKMSDKSAVPHLLKLLGSEDEGYRFYSLEALGKLGDENIGYHISEILSTDPNARVRVEAIRTLDVLNARSESSAVMGALSDSDPFLRAYAVQLSGLWNIKNTLAKIIQMLKYDNDDIVKISCAQSLALYEDMSAVPDLINTLVAVNTDLRISAADSLKKISGKDFGFKREEWQKWYDEARTR